MEQFLAKHADHVTGSLSGFDRLVFRGTLRMLAHRGGMMHYLQAVRVLLKDFAGHAEALTRRLKVASEDLAKRPQSESAIQATSCRPIGPTDDAKHDHHVIPASSLCHTPVTIPRLSSSPDNPVPHVSSTTHTIGVIPRPATATASRRRPRARPALLAAALLAPSAIFLLLFTYAPVVRVLVSSLTVRTFQGAAHPGIGNYTRLFADPHFTTAVTNNVLYAAGTIIPSLTLALAFALGLRESTRLHTTLRTLIALPLLIPLVAAAALFIFIFLPGAGLLDYYLPSSALRRPTGSATRPSRSARSLRSRCGRTPATTCCSSSPAWPASRRSCSTPRRSTEPFGGALVPGQNNVFASTIDLTGFAFAHGQRLSPIDTVFKFAPFSSYDSEIRADMNPNGAGGVLDAGITSHMKRGRLRASPSLTFSSTARPT